MSRREQEVPATLKDNWTRLPLGFGLHLSDQKFLAAAAVNDSRRDAMSAAVKLLRTLRAPALYAFYTEEAPQLIAGNSQTPQERNQQEHQIHLDAVEQLRVQDSDSYALYQEALVLYEKYLVWHRELFNK